MTTFRAAQRTSPDGETFPPRLEWTPSTDVGWRVVGQAIRSTMVQTVASMILEVPDELTVDGCLQLRDGTAIVILFVATLDAEVPRYKVTDVVVRPAADDGEIGPDTLRMIPFPSLVGEALYRIPHHVRVAGREVPEGGLDVEELSPGEYTAMLWSLAQLAGAEPNQFIADDLGISAQAAAQRVVRARRSGLIPPASKPGARR